MYNDIAQNKRRTWILITLMSSIVIGLSWFIGAINGLEAGPSIIIGTIFASIYSLISYYASSSIALAVSGAKAIQKSQAPELYNIVENLCIANGQPTPTIYIIQDASPNALATGRDPAHASIAFTTGLLNILTHEEIEGVAAHELSHVKNYDIRVMTVVVVLVGLISLIADLLLYSRFRSGDRDNGNAGIALFFIGVILAVLSPLFAQIIQLAISRSREYLADASSALLTRYPEGLAKALEKIGATEQPMQKANHATAHLYISNPFGNKAAQSFYSKLFSTHPPITDRISRLRSMGR